MYMYIRGQRLWNTEMYTTLTVEKIHHELVVRTNPPFLARYEAAKS